MVFGWNVEMLKNPKYADTWDLWEKERYLSGVRGARCTKELKRLPREWYQYDNDIHIFGYTADSRDIRRADALKSHYPELMIETPLIDKGITKSACRAMLKFYGISEPLTYSLGFPNANCMPCVKSQSPAYWSLVRKHFPNEFIRMAKLSRELGVRLVKIKSERVFIDEIPLDHPTTDPQVIDCDILCQIALSED